jgi:hypothetical protein
MDNDMEEMNDYLRLNIMENNINNNRKKRKQELGKVWQRGGNKKCLNATYSTIMTCYYLFKKVLAFAITASPFFSLRIM